MDCSLWPLKNENGGGYSIAVFWMFEGGGLIPSQSHSHKDIIQLLLFPKGIIASVPSYETMFDKCIIVKGLRLTNFFKN